MDRVKDSSKDKAKMSVEARSRFEVAMKKQTKVRPKIANKIEINCTISVAGDD